MQLGTKGAGYHVGLNGQTDTLASVAINLATACVAAGITATSSNATVTITASGYPTVSVGVSWNRQREVQRRRKVFFASLYAATPYDRSAIGKVIETVYSSGTRLSMPDGTLATLVPMNGNPMQSSDFDAQQRDTTWMRRVSWVFDFLSTQVLSVTQVVAEGLSFTGTTDPRSRWSAHSTYRSATLGRNRCPSSFTAPSISAVFLIYAVTL